MRIERLAAGNPGKCRFLGNKVTELIIDHGPGYRVYYTSVGREIVLLLCGGDKSTQQDDIDKAYQLAAKYG
jgi:putative addiction module killer protein